MPKAKHQKAAKKVESADINPDDEAAGESQRRMRRRGLQDDEPTDTPEIADDIEENVDEGDESPVDGPTPVTDEEKEEPETTADDIDTEEGIDDASEKEKKIEDLGIEDGDDGNDTIDALSDLEENPDLKEEGVDEVDLEPIEDEAGDEADLEPLEDEGGDEADLEPI